MNSPEGRGWIPERADVLLWLKARPENLEPVDAFAIGYPDREERLWCVVLADPAKLCVVYWAEPTSAAGKSPPDEVCDMADQRLERWRNDPRPWVVCYLDLQVQVIESKDSDGLWQKCYVGSEEAIRRIRDGAVKAGEPVGEPQRSTLSDVQALTRAWLRIP